MKMKRYELADRGFYGYEFKDIYGEECSIQESSLATSDALWLGAGENRMHIDKPLAKKLIKFLRYFYRTGKLPAKETINGKG